jgi:hypothetical protein
MMRILVLFNLRPGVDPKVYESWARGTDSPTVRGLPSISGFTVHRLTGLLMGQGEPPFQYAEVIDVADMDQFGRDITTPAMQVIAGAFQSFADNPLFITTKSIA